MAVVAGTLFAAPAAAEQPTSTRMTSIIPAPVSAQPNPRADYEITGRTAIHAPREAKGVADYLVGVLGSSTGHKLRIEAPKHNPKHGINLVLGGLDRKRGPEAYDLDVTKHGVVLRANADRGLFAGVQTLRQLLPTKSDARRHGWRVSGGTITDEPRFGYRGAMLDVARHFFTVDDVKRYIDLISQYKINHLHLHLADDQGWRIEIKSWPRLATYGGSTEVGGGPGGYYTQEDYKALVAYAAERQITVVPEIDMPGHTNAALASYAELNCDGVAPPLYTGTDVGFSSLCIGKEITYTFIDDVLRELSALTPGPYLHIGSDEAHSTPEPDYLKFIERVMPIVAKHGKTVAGWHEFLKATPPTSALPQYWGTTNSNTEVTEAAQRGNKILMSPANKAYMDMKYDPSTPLGLSWAGYIEVADAYGWNPGTHMQGVPESAVIGLEAPLWSETLENIDHIEFMAFPRLPAYAELGWSAWSTHDWESFRQRLARQGPKWTEQGVDFYRSPQIPWPA
ncbi:family 20 glycosylhydrolase [Herbihabitans rhizosphaerae]|nr:family 20 glycosylhydrolase [Herbihabitans rhizosphaerae]